MDQKPMVTLPLVSFALSSFVCFVYFLIDSPVSYPVRVWGVYWMAEVLPVAASKKVRMRANK